MKRERWAGGGRRQQEPPLGAVAGFATVRGYQYQALSDDRNLVDLNQMGIDAVRRSQGHCQAFCAEGTGLRDVFLHCLAEQAPLLKSLVLVSCGEVSCQGIMEAIKCLPLLEELEFSNCCKLQRMKEVLEVVAEECPRLKCLRYRCIGSDYYDWNYYWKDDGEAMAIAKMHELRSLHLVHNDLTNQGLEAILNKCLHLESLGIHDCLNICMDDKMRATINTKKVLTNYTNDGKREVEEPDIPDSECSTCFNYFKCDKKSYYARHYGMITYPKHYVNDTEAMVISTVYELRSLQLDRNDLTSKGLAAILDKCPHLDSLDVWNCLNIVRDNTRQAATCGWIKTKKLTTKLLLTVTGCYNPGIFNPEGLDLHNCCNIILNKFRNIFADDTLGAKYKRFILRKKAKKYHRSNTKMMAEFEKYMIAKRHIDTDNIDGASKYNRRYDYRILNNANFERCYNYKYCRDFDKKFEPDGPINECSTCLMFEYFAERWGVLDLDEYADYYDLDGHDETDFGLHDRMIGKRLRRYLKMEGK